VGIFLVLIADSQRTILIIVNLPVSFHQIMRCNSNIIVTVAKQTFNREEEEEDDDDDDDDVEEEEED